MTYANDGNMEAPDEIANTPTNRAVMGNQLFKQGKLKRITTRRI